MRVLLDIHLLGGGHAKTNVRRGIFRYTENLANCLADRGELDLTFCASRNWYYVYQCLDYLDTNDKIRGRDFAQPDTRLMRSLSRTLARLDSTARGGSGGIGTVARKGAREFIRGIFSARHFFRGDLMGARYLPGADIYHSPHFLSMPKEVRTMDIKKNFVTVHDIIPVVAPELGFGRPENHRRFGAKLKALTGDDWVFAVSKYTADDLCGFADNLDPDKVVVVPLAAAGHFKQCRDQAVLRAVREKYNIPEENRYLLSLSALEPRKNFEAVITSFRDIVMQEKLDDLSLVLVGQEHGGFQRKLNDLVSSTGLEDRIVFTGYVPDEDLSPIYSGAAAFLFPSFYEGFGLPPLEAMQCGIPVIASDRTSVPEVVGDAGLLIDPDSVDDLCTATLRVLEDGALREELSRRSIIRAAQFSWDNHAEMTVEGYRRALES